VGQVGQVGQTYPTYLAQKKSGRVSSAVRGTCVFHTRPEGQALETLAPPRRQIRSRSGGQCDVSNSPVPFAPPGRGPDGEVP